MPNAARHWTLVWRVSGSELLARWQQREPRSPLTPALSPEERENYRLRGNQSRPPAISCDKRQSTLSFGARAGVRGNGAPGLTLPPKTSLARVRPSLHSERHCAPMLGANGSTSDFCMSDFCIAFKGVCANFDG